MCQRISSLNLVWFILNPTLSANLNIRCNFKEYVLPDKCSITYEGKVCVNPPEFVVSVFVDPEEFMVGVTCEKHKQIVSGKIEILQKQGKIPNGKVRFSKLKAVGTDCIHGNEEDFVQIDTKNFKN